LQTIFFVNLAVSLVMASGLWLVWRYDREQGFARSIAITTVLNGGIGIVFGAWQTAEGVWRHGFALLMCAMVGAMYTFLWRGVAELRCQKSQLKIGPAAFLAVLAVYLILIETGHHALLGLVNCVLWVATGVVCGRILWHRGWFERALGILIGAIGLNSLFLVLFEKDGMEPMFAVGVVLRVALGMVFMVAAMARTQHSTQQAKERFKVLSQNALMGVVVVGADRLQYANPTAARLAGCSSVEELLAQDLYAALPEVHRMAVRDQLRQLMSGEVAHWEGPCHCINKAGESVHLQVSAWRIQWDGSDAVQVVIHDETQKFLAEQEFKSLQDKYELQRVEFAERSKNALLKANSELEARVTERTAQLEEASRAKGQFLASMSHEIRTPMNVVLGLLELLQATQQTSLQSDYTHKAKRAAKSLLALLNDLLDFSKIDAGKMELELLPFSVERLLRDLSNMVPTMVGSKPVEVLFDIDPAVPDALVGDALRLQQVLLNLLSNAIKFTAEGEVVVQLEVCSSNQQEATLRIAVRDTGIGIAPENQRAIFEVFAQAEASITRRFGGSGLGLSICKKLLSLMQSDLQVQSEAGKGSCFFFELTLPRVAMEAIQGGAQEMPPTERPLSVLVVDDNDAARKLTVTMARGIGWKVEAVESGLQALERIEAVHAAGDPLFDVILVDWRMQPLDGWETLRAVRKRYPVDQLPVCVMTSANGRDVLGQRSQDEQALLSAYLTKPLTAAMLSDAVESARSGHGNVRAGSRSKIPKGVRLRGLRLLLVEDNPLNQLVARELLSAEGAKVTTADNGQLGVARLAADPQAFDAVLMDMQMPVMDGCTATRAIRKTLELTDLPVIAMTANTMQSDKDACLAAGMNDHVGKPFDVGYLVDVIRRQCGMPSFNVRAASQSASVADPQAPFDVEGAIATLGGDRALYKDVLQAFLDELQALPDVLAEQLQSTDRLAAKRTLHTLKGTAATVGAMALSRAARAAESEVTQQAHVDADERILVLVREAAQEAVRQLTALATAE